MVGPFFTPTGSGGWLQNEKPGEGHQSPESNDEDRLGLLGH